MAQDEFDGVGTHGDARAIWNSNAVDAEARLAFLEGTPFVQLTDYHTVEELADFPAPVGGEITLTSGVWWINGSIDMGGNRLIVPGDARLYSVVSQTGVLTWTSGTGPRIQLDVSTGDEIFTRYNLTLIDTVAGQDMFETTGICTAVVLQTVQVSGCLGFVDVSRTFFAGQCNFFSVCDGFRFGTGTGKNRLILTDCAFNHAPSGVVGPCLDLETSEWSRVTLNNVFFVTASGFSAIEALPNSGNVTTGGIAEVLGCGFSGDGDALSGGVNENDVQWLFTACIGQPSSVSFGQCTITGNTVATVADGTFEPWAGTTFSQGSSTRWTVSNTGVATYNGVTPLKVIYTVNFSVEMDTGGRRDVAFNLYHTPIATGTPVAVGNTLVFDVGGARESAVSFQAVVDVVNGDELQMRLSNTEDANGVLITESEAFIITVPSGG